MTPDLDRLNDLRERVESGDATAEEHSEWLRLRIAVADERLRRAEMAFPADFKRHVAQAISDLEQRTQSLSAAEMIEAGRCFFTDFERQWGEEAAREAWKEVQPPKRHGRAEWQAIPPARPRAHHTSAHAHFRRFSQANRADLLATTPTQPGRTLSKNKAARAVMGEKAAEPSRHFRRLKGPRPPIRD